MKLKTLPMCLLACAISTVFAAGAQAEEKKSIVTVVKVTGINWFTRMEEGVKEFAKANPEINASQTGPGRADAAQQLKIVQDLVAKNVSALAIVPFDPPTLEPILARAKSRGIKIVTHEADNLKNTDYDLEAFKNNEYGADLNERLAKCMTNKGEWAVLVGSLGSRSQVQWAQGGIDNAKAKYPDLKLVTTMQETNNDGEKAYQVAQQLLRKYPNLAGFQGSSSLDVIGIGRAVEEAGKAGKICVFGTGLPGEAGPYMEKDAITGIAFWDPKDAGMAMNNVAKMLLEGKTIENGTDLGVPGYDKVTVEKGPGKGMIIRGAGWVRVDKSNYKQYNF